MPVTYGNYLKLDQILSAQQPLSDGPEHDELLFIIIHQVYELWFKQVLHELDYLQQKLAANDTPRALHTLRRILTILKTMVAQIDILETMTPLEFLSFRHRLDSASGFQSDQFRELELALGLKRRAILAHYPEDMPARSRLERRYEQPTLWDAFLHYLAANSYPVPPELLKRDVTQPVEPSPEVQKILIEVYRNNPTLTQVCENLVDLDEGIQEWRYRHIKMVERTIGTKQGTGGSAGVKYLSTTLLKPIFPDLWAIRTEL
jgi:tryptophan 2,3-dioxygenase